MREREKAIVRSPDMADDPTPLPEDHHLLRDANDPDDWAWRRAIRQRPAALAAYTTGAETIHRMTPCNKNTVNRLTHQKRGPW